MITWQIIEAIDNSVEDLRIQEGLAAHGPKRRPRAEPQPTFSASMQDEIRLKQRLKRYWQVTRDASLKAHVNLFQRSVGYRLNKQRNGECRDELESLDSVDQSP